MVKRSSTLLSVLIIIISCHSTKTRVLDNTHTRVPYKKSFFTKKYRLKHKVVLPKGVKNNAIYRESCHLDYYGNKFFSTNGVFSILKFYSNGCVSSFPFLERTNIKSEDLNVEYHGYRGIIYIKDNKQIMSLFVPINQSYHYGMRDYIIDVSGDSLYIKRTNNPKKDKSITVYVKDTLYQGEFLYKADW